MPAISGELTLENAKLKASLAEASAELKRFKAQARSEGAGLGNALFGKLKGIGGDVLAKLGLAGGVVGVAGTVQRIAEEYSKLADMAARFDAAPMSLQRLDMHARLTGTSVESLVTGVQRLQRAMEDTGDEKVQKAMKELGLSAVDLAGLQPDQQIEMIAQAFNRAQLEGRGFAAVFDLMGRSAGEIIPTLREFAANKEKISKIKFLSDEDVRAIKEFSDAAALLSGKAKAAAATAVMHFGEAAMGEKGVAAAAFAMSPLGMLRAAFKGKSTDEVEHGWASGLTALLQQATTMENLKSLAEKRASFERKVAFELADQAERAAQAKRDAKILDRGERAAALGEAELFGTRGDRMRLMRDQLAASLGLKQINGAEDVRQGIEDLRNKAHSQRISGDVEGAKETYDQIADAEALAGRLAGLGRSRHAAVAGETAIGLGILTGRGGNDLVLDESKRGNQLLEQIKNVLEDIKRDRSGDGAYDIPRGSFGFDL